MRRKIKIKMRLAMVFFIIAAMAAGNLGVLTAGAATDETPLTQQAEAPTAEPAAGTYTQTQNIVLTSKTDGALIYYTTDGTQPTAQSTLFEIQKPIVLEKTATIQAIAIKGGMTDSQVTVLEYRIEPPVEPPTEPKTEPIKEPKTEPPTEPKTEPPTEPPTEPKTEPPTDPPTEPKTEPTTDPTTEPKTEPTTEPPTEPKTEPTTDPTTEPKTEPTTDPTTEPKTEPTTEPATDPATDPDPIPDPPPVSNGLLGTSASQVAAPNPVLQEITAASISAKDTVLEGTALSELAKTDLYQLGDGGDYTLKSINWEAYPADQTATALEAGKTYRITAVLESAEGYSFAQNIQITFGAGQIPLTVTAGLEQPSTPENQTTQTGAGTSGSNEPRPASNPTTPAPAVTQITASGNVTMPKSPEFELPSGAEIKDGALLGLKAAETGGTLWYKLEPGGDQWARYDAQSKVTAARNDTGKITLHAKQAAGSFETLPVKAEYIFEPEPDIVIKEVNLSGITPASRGKKPDSSIDIASDAHGTVQDVKWSDANGNPVTGIFRAGQKYTLGFVVKADDKYVFSADTVFKADGKAVTISGHGDDWKTVSLLFEYTTEPPVKADAKDNKISGIKKSYYVNDKITYTATGAGGSIKAEEGNERYVPVSYKVGTRRFDINDGTIQVTRAFKSSGAGDYILRVYFQRQVYDAEQGAWLFVKDAIDEKSVSVKIIARPVARTTKYISAKTADNAPVLGTAVVLLVSAGAVFLILIRKKRKST